MAEADTTKDTMPIPPRFWWFKRIVLVMVLFAGLLVGLRYFSLHVAKSRLEAEIAALRARGEPLTAQDFVEQPVPPEQDAGPELLAAGTMFVVSRQHLTTWNNIYPVARSYSPKDAATIDAVLGANQTALAKVRAARRKHVANLSLALQSASVPYQRLWELRQVSDALALAALKGHAERKDDQAVEYLRDGITLARALESQPMMMTQLVAEGMLGRPLTVIKTIAPTLRIGAANGAASEAQIKAMMQELLDDREGARSGSKWAWQKERQMQMDLIYALASDDLMKSPAMKLRTSNPASWWMRPVEVANAHDLLVMENTYVKAAGAPDAPEAFEIWRDWGNRSPRNRDLARLGSPVIGNLNSQYRTVYLRREAAVALAARMFELKYGREANNIWELVPEFLDEAPKDPLLGKGQTMVVHPLDKAR